MPVYKCCRHCSRTASGDCKWVLKHSAHHDWCADCSPASKAPPKGQQVLPGT